MANIYVIVPVYNVEPFLKRCVDSILAQTYRDFKLVLVDDESPDRCPELCDEFAKTDDRIAVIHRKNGCLGAARNSGIELALSDATCEYLTFIDSDDWVLPQYLEHLYLTLTSADADISLGFFQLVYPDTEVKSVGERQPSYPIDGIETCSRMVAGYEGTPYAVAWGKIFKKELWRDIRFPEKTFFEDTHTMHKVYYDAKTVSVLEEPLYLYFQRDGSIMNRPFSIRRLERDYGLLARAEFYREKGLDDLFHDGAKLFVRFTAGDYEKCIAQGLDREETAVRLKQEYNRIFDEEKKQLPMFDYAECYCTRYAWMRAFWFAVFPMIRFTHYVKENGAFGAWRRICQKLKSK